MQNTTPETSVTALLTHDKDWQNRITVPSEEYEKLTKSKAHLPMPTAAWMNK